MLTAVLVASAPGHAEVYKCTDASGKTHYADHPCSPGTARSYTPPPLTTIEASRLTGGRKAPEKAKDKWVSPLDPVAACHARGGEIDKEMRACRLP